jgi:hypothetical protein
MSYNANSTRIDQLGPINQALRISHTFLAQTPQYRMSNDVHQTNPSIVFDKKHVLKEKNRGLSDSIDCQCAALGSRYSDPPRGRLSERRRVVRRCVVRPVTRFGSCSLSITRSAGRSQCLQVLDRSHWQLWSYCDGNIEFTSERRPSPHPRARLAATRRRGTRVNCTGGTVTFTSHNVFCDQ